MTSILAHYGFTDGSYLLSTYGTGLINHTWLVQDKQTNQKYILQKINHQIFKSPEDIAFNISAIADYLKLNMTNYHFEAPLLTTDGKSMVIQDGEYYRLFCFVEKSHTIDVVQNEHQAFEAAKQFGQFTAALDRFDATQLKITLPDFHNLPLRFEQFKTALKTGNPERISETPVDIQFLLDNEKIVHDSYLAAKLPVRVIHHDTKISNVLLDNNDNGICVIDLDTIMPGRFISDLGDMMRTYLSPVSEEEADFSKIEVRTSYFKAIINGYLCGGMNSKMTASEKDFLVYSGKFMIYMQALRFITDYLNNDIYYGARYQKHNLVRGRNQIELLKQYLKHEKEFVAISKSY